MTPSKPIVEIAQCKDSVLVRVTHSYIFGGMLEAKEWVKYALRTKPIIYDGGIAE